jgi:hypothetical protein
VVPNVVVMKARLSTPERYHQFTKTPVHQITKSPNHQF